MNVRLMRSIFFRMLGLVFLFAGFLVLHPVSALAAPDQSIRNASGVINRPLSVDLTGREEGYSTVLYNNPNGLPTSEANAIAETSDGFIWIGSYGGLVRYDGNTFERIDSTTGIGSVKSLYVDSRDRLWIGTNDTGVAVMDTGSLQKWGTMEGMKSAHIRGIVEGPDGTIYVATTCGMAMIDEDGNLSMMEEEEIAEMNIRGIRGGSDGTIYGLSNFGDMFKIRDRKLINFLPAAETPMTGVGTLFPDPEKSDGVYIEGADYVFYHVTYSDKLTDLEPISIEPLSYVQQMEMIDGKLFICAANGIGILEDGQIHVLDDLPMNSNVISVMTDYLGNLWFTSTRQGVMKVVPNQFSNPFDRFGLEERVVNTTCMYEDKIFVGTDTGLVVLEQDGPVEHLPLTKAVTASGVDLETDDLITFLESCRIRSIIRDSKDRLWISVWRKYGLLRYDHGELTAFTEEEGLLSSGLRAVSEKKDGTIIVAVTGGANVIEGDRVVASYGSEDGIMNTESLCIEEGWDGDIVLGSNGDGIYIINSSGIRNIGVNDGLPSDIVLRLKRDEKRDLIWIVASSALAYMTPDYKVTTIQKFPYANNFDLYENSREDMWVLSSNGIYVTPAAELVANEEIHPVFYSIANGMPCITTANSYSELTPDGDLYIAGGSGICKVNIEHPLEDVNDLKVTVPYLEADDERIYADEDGIFTISARTQKVTIPSYVFNYSLNDPKVSYQLVGFDPKSTTISRSEMVPVDYTNLRGGSYTYVVQVHDALGRGNREISIPIIKEKKLYEHVWFNILLVLLILAFIFIGARYYVLRKTRILDKRHRQTMSLISEITEAFAKIIDMKDSYTNGHSSRVAKYTEMLARELGCDDETVEKYYRIALLHDIGKVGIPPEVLNKPGKLTDEEYGMIKSHTTLGYEALKDISIMPELAIGAQAHHERPDGCGYPNGLKGDEIPRVAQIIAVADCFDAMYSNRPYRNRMNFEKAVSIIKEVSGTQLTSDVVDAFIRLVERGEMRDPEDTGGGSMENIENIRNSSSEE